MPPMRRASSKSMHKEEHRTGVHGTHLAGLKHGFVLKPADLAQVKQLFAKIDADGGGSISKGELKKGMAYLNDASQHPWAPLAAGLKKALGATHDLKASHYKELFAAIAESHAEAASEEDFIDCFAGLFGSKGMADKAPAQAAAPAAAPAPAEAPAEAPVVAKAKPLMGKAPMAPAPPVYTDGRKRGLGIIPPRIQYIMTKIENKTGKLTRMQIRELQMYQWGQLEYARQATSNSGGKINKNEDA